MMRRDCTAWIRQCARVGENREERRPECFREEREAVLHVAGQGSCVIVGRGADYILRNETRLFRVFVSAGMDFRIQRVVKRDGITQDEARDRIRSMDKARSAYYNRRSGPCPCS